MSSIPLGHTAFSWQSASKVPLGHTAFSWTTSTSDSSAAAAATNNEGETKETTTTAVIEASFEKRSGPLSNFAGEESAALNKFYITTAINYTNGDPHVGHAYEAVTTDILARWHRVFGRDTYFCTGTDEHGEKIAKTAEKEGVLPIDICNKYAQMFQDLNQRLNISNDCYIRTTQESHQKVVKELWQRCVDKVSVVDKFYHHKLFIYFQSHIYIFYYFHGTLFFFIQNNNDNTKGDIWLGQYEGWYNVKEECYVKDSDAEKDNYLDTAGQPLIQMSQESYLLNMGKYQNELISKM